MKDPDIKGVRWIFTHESTALGKAGLSKAVTNALKAAGIPYTIVTW
jgi:hypothetical protein